MAGGGRTRRTRGALLAALGAALLLGALLYASLFTVDVTEYGVVTRFGRVVRVVDEPGLHAKAPFDRVARLDRRLLYSEPAQAEYLTADKKNVVVRGLTVWRIADPGLFLRTLATRADAEVRLADVVLAEIGAALGRHPLSSFISARGQESRFGAMVDEVRAAVRAFARPAYGIEVVDVDVRQLGLPEQNKQSVFERMKAERGKMAKEYRSEGARDAEKIVAAADGERTRILAEAYEEAQRIRAEGEAGAMRIYAEAFSRNPGFYKFLRTLQAYETILDDATTVFLPADAEIFGMLHGDRAAPAEGPDGIPPAGTPPVPRADGFAASDADDGDTAPAGPAPPVAPAPASVEADAGADRGGAPASLNGGFGVWRP